MLDILKEVVTNDTVDGFNSLCCSVLDSGVLLVHAEMTEDELQALEERADRWLMDAGGIL